MTLPTPTPLTDAEIEKIRAVCATFPNTQVWDGNAVLRALATITSLQSDLAQARSMAIAAGEYQLAAESDLQRMRDAVKAVYYAAHWTADRPVDEDALWTNLRDAAGLVPGNAPTPPTGT